LDNFVWLLEPVDGSAVAAVDGPDARAVLDFCQARGKQLGAVINTHTHHDHIGINNDLARRGLLRGLRVIGPKRVAASVPGLTEAVDEGDSITIGGSVARVLLTEGHLDGHVSYVFPGVLFCGDTMFGAGCGYLFDGPPAKMFDSLSRLSQLDGSTRVCCAHEYTQDNLRFAWSVDPGNPALAERIARVWHLRSAGQATIPTTIAEEKATNPFLRFDSDRLKERVHRAMPERSLDTPLDTFTATRALKDRKDYKSLSDSDLPLTTPSNE
jgi:hydroxyacylglutathione hydrolase